MHTVYVRQGTRHPLTNQVNSRTSTQCPTITDNVFKKADRSSTSEESSYAWQSTHLSKITGDGTRISRNMHTVVIAFACECFKGSHSVAIMNLSKDYEELAELLQDINDVNSLKIVTVDIVFSIELFWVLTWNFWLLLLEFKVQMRSIHMYDVSAERYKTRVQWSITDTDKGTRTIEEAKKLCSLSSKHGVETYGCIREPIFSSVPIDHIVPDIFHLLRVSDVLTNLLILEPFNTWTKKPGWHRKAGEGTQQTQSNQCGPVWALPQSSVHRQWKTFKVGGYTAEGSGINVCSTN